MKPINLAATAAFALALGNAATAAPVTLTFEGIGDQQLIGSTYEAAYGVVFSSSAQARVSKAAGGSGNFENEPSPSTVMDLNSASATMNRAAGIVGALSFYYSSAVPGSVAVYDNLDGTGNLLNSISLVNQAADGCPLGEPFCNWDVLDLSFRGTAKSVVFTGLASQLLFDDISFTAAAVVTPVATPGTVPLLLTALGALAFTARRRREIGLAKLPALT